MVYSHILNMMLACKYNCLLEHSEVSLQGVGSLHLQCCIHLGRPTRLSGFPVKTNMPQSVNAVI